MRRPSIGAWLTPLSLGTFAGGWSFAALSAFFHRVPAWIAWLPYVDVAKWLVWFVVLTLLSFAQLVTSALVDVALLKFKVRALPTGLRAAIVAFAGPPIVGFLLRAWPTLGLHVGLWVATSLALVAGVSVLLRALFGQKIEA